MTFCVSQIYCRPRKWAKKSRRRLGESVKSLFSLNFVSQLFCIRTENNSRSYEFNRNSQSNPRHSKSSYSLNLLRYLSPWILCAIKKTKTFPSSQSRRIFKIKTQTENNLDLSIVLLSPSKSIRKLLESLVASQHNPELSLASSHTHEFSDV